MARSYRHPSFYDTDSHGMQDWKKQARREFRRLSKITLTDIGEDCEIDIELPEHIKEVSDLWYSPEGGRKGYCSQEEIEQYHQNPIKATRK